MTMTANEVKTLSNRVHGLLQEQEDRKSPEDRYARQLCSELVRLRVNHALALRAGRVSARGRLEFDARHMALQRDLRRIYDGNSTFPPLDRGLSKTTQETILHHLKKKFTDTIHPTRERYGDEAYEAEMARARKVRWVPVGPRYSPWVAG